MVFANKIKQLREEKQLFQRQLAEVLEIDTPMYCKIERGTRPIKRSQVIVLARYFSIEEKELLAFWLVDKVIDVLVDDNDLAEKVLDMTQTFYCQEINN